MADELTGGGRPISAARADQPLWSRHRYYDYFRPRANRRAATALRGISRSCSGHLCPLIRRHACDRKSPTTPVYMAATTRLFGPWMTASAGHRRAARPRRCSRRNRRLTKRPVDPSTHQPHVLPTLPASALREATAAPTQPMPPAAKAIPTARLPRIRTWVRYGMTIPKSPSSLRR